MPLPKIDVPARLAGAFDSEVPVGADLAQLGQTDIGQQLLSDAARWSQMASARLWEALPQTVPTGGQKLLETAWTARDLAETYRNGELGDKLAAISEGGLAVLETTFEALSLVEAVPLIGMVAKIGITAQKLFWNQWIAKHKAKAPEEGFAYDRESDVQAQQDVLREIEAGDLTGIFLPFVEVESWERRTVQDLEKGGNNRWTFVIPKGPRVGIGSVPGTNVIARGWQHTFPWSAYRPGAVNACSVAWQLALGDTRARYLVDARQLHLRWETFWTRLRIMAANPDYAMPLKNALNPKILRPSNGGSTWVDAFDYSKAKAAGYTADLPGLCAFNILNGLRGRQVKGLGTLLVAYVSENDPAFRSDEALAELLASNRAKLLTHDAVRAVELDRIPGEDRAPDGSMTFLEAVKKAQSGKGAGQIKGKGKQVLPTPAVAAIPSPLPDVGGETAEPRKIGLAWKVAGALGVVGGIAGLVFFATRKA